MLVLGVESSCDETSVALLENDKVLVNLVASQDFHTKYGGVVPELSSRIHIQKVIPLFNDALERAGKKKEEIDLVCATAGPGLIGALLVGYTFGRGLAYSLNKPFIPVNHIEGHIFSGFLSDTQPEYPFLTLCVSGGHSLLLLVKSPGEYIKLGETIDDAAGEAFDKVAKLIGLGYPGGPKISRYANTVEKTDIVFPVARTKEKYDFSFSGLKTSVLRTVQSLTKNGAELTEHQKGEIALAFELTAVKSLIKNARLAMEEFKPLAISLVGGVAANTRLRSAVTELATEFAVPAVIPAFAYCGDNAAMIGLRGYMVHQLGETFSLEYDAFPSFRSKYMTSLSAE